jgi:hypothetical protein
VGNVQFLYPDSTSANLNQSGTNPDWALEDTLDLEWARAAAPGATLDMTFSPNADAGLYAAVDALVASAQVDVLSMSWGEPDVGTYDAFDTPCASACNATSDGSYAILGPVLELGAAEGISIFSASGDCGSADGTSGVATNFPASDPYVTGVGGTVLSLGANESYAGETAWSGNATGAVSPGCENQGGSGGGFAPSPQPWWQTGIVDPTGARGVPDVALDAGSPVEITFGGLGASVEGTSVGTPIWAGLAALADQAHGSDLGLLNPSLYRILNSAQYAADFHPVLSGSNGAYSAASGWNPVTGIGTPNAAELVPDLARGGGLAGGSLSTFAYASPRFGAAPLNASLTLSASGGVGAYRLEGISFGDGTSELFNGTPLDHVYNATGLYLVQSFVVDASGNASVSPPVLVSVGGGALSVSLESSIAAPAVGADVTLTATASGGSAPYAYQFFFGDGSSSAPGSIDPVVHAYAVAGGFCAEVVATDAAAPADGATSARVALDVGGAPAPSCGNPATPIALGPPVGPLVRDAPADLQSTLFEIEGGTSAPGLSPSVAFSSSDPYTAACSCAIFPTSGNYTVTEWVNDTVQGSANATATLMVVPALSATFAASNVSGPAPLSVYFFAKSDGGFEADASTTQWTFGNGQGAVGHTVNATYKTPGEYLAVGHLTDPGGGNQSEAFLIDVEPPAGAPPLGLSVTVAPAVDIPSGSTVVLTVIPNEAATTLGDTFVNWSLGDGHSAWGDTVSETYFGPLPAAAANTLPVEVTLTDPYLNPLANVSFALPAFFGRAPDGAIPAVDAMEVNDTIQPDHGIVPFTIYGNVTDSGPRPIGLAWTYGDGESGSGPTLEHTYYGAQGYTAKLVATDPFGNQATLLSEVAAEGALSIAGGPSPTGGPRPFTTQVHAEAYGGKGPPYTYSWTFPNGTHSVATGATLYFANAGSYVLRLNVTDRDGELAERNWTIVVGYAYPLAPLETLLGAAALGAVLAVVVRYRATPHVRAEPIPPEGKSRW